MRAASQAMALTSTTSPRAPPSGAPKLQLHEGHLTPGQGPEAPVKDAEALQEGGAPGREGKLDLPADGNKAPHGRPLDSRHRDRRQPSPSEAPQGSWG